MNLTERALLPEKFNEKEFLSMTKWHYEIINTFPTMIEDSNQEPIGFKIESLCPIAKHET
jgi:hypothetical protein